ncbi:hypothetical protein RA280_46305 [Cupriavidus sp. CV2]|nr:hypothetical protein [Cupriavidus sp. CV2]
MLIRNLADNTQKSYLLQVASFARHFRRSPDLLGPEEIRAWPSIFVKSAGLRPAVSVLPLARCGSSTASRSSDPGAMRTFRCRRSRLGCR